MKLSEFDKIRPFLPDYVQIIVVDSKEEVDMMIHPVTKQKVQRKPLEKQTWGNHDGRYNAHCPICGWTSGDIPARDPMPTYCPNCGNGK